MKNRFKHILSGLLIITFMSAVVTSFGQPTVTLNTTSLTTGLAPGATVSVEVIVNIAGTNLGSFAMLVNYDRDVLTHISTVADPSLTSLGGTFLTNPNYAYPPAPSTILSRVAWNYTPIPPGSGGIPCTNQLIFTMNFTFNGGSTGATPIAFFATNVVPTGSRIQTPPGTYDYTTVWSGSIAVSGSFADITSVTAGGNWATAATWDLGHVPNTSNGTVIINSSTNPVTTAANVTWPRDLRITPAGKLTLNTGISLSIAGNMSIESDATGTGSFLNQGTLSVTGSTSAQRWITANWISGFPNTLTTWHYVSSPVTGATIATFLGSLLNHWNEPTEYWIVDTLPITNPLLPCIGYGLAKHVPDSIVTFTGGTLNNDAVYSPVITRLSPGTFPGWNLLGNPYPCAISWNLLVKSLVLGTVYTWNATTGNYVNYNGTVGALTDGIIPAEQAFFVQALTNSATISIPAASRLHSGTALYKNTIENLLTMKIQGNDVYEDYAFIHFRPEATGGFDQDYDAYKLWGMDDAPQLYSISTDNLTINSLPGISEQPIIPIGLRVGLVGTYTFTASDLETFAPGTEIFLEDILTNHVQNLTSNPVYTFSASSEDAAHRFNVHFAPVGVSENSLFSGIHIYSAERTIYINIPNDMRGSIVVYNLLGSEISRTAIRSNSLNKINLDIPSGFYLVRVDGNTNTTSGKVFIR